MDGTLGESLNGEIHGTLHLPPPLTVYLMSKDSVRQQWEEIEAFIARDLDYVLEGSMTLADVRERALEGLLALWVARDRKLRAVAFVEIWPSPRTKLCKILGLIGEDMGKWIEGLSAIEAWARDRGCSKVHVEGRNAWSRVLSDYRVTGVVLEKAL